MDAAFEPGSYEAGRLGADAKMAKLATVFHAYLEEEMASRITSHAYLEEEVAPRITSHLVGLGVLPEGARVVYELQD